jgi:hypothetical protein
MPSSNHGSKQTRTSSTGNRAAVAQPALEAHGVRAKEASQYVNGVFVLRGRRGLSRRVVESDVMFLSWPLPVFSQIHAADTTLARHRQAQRGTDWSAKHPNSQCSLPCISHRRPTLQSSCRTRHTNSTAPTPYVSDCLSYSHDGECNSQPRLKLSLPGSMRARTEYIPEEPIRWHNLGDPSKPAFVKYLISCVHACHQAIETALRQFHFRVKARHSGFYKMK